MGGVLDSNRIPFVLVELLNLFPHTTVTMLIMPLVSHSIRGLTKSASWQAGRSHKTGGGWRTGVATSGPATTQTRHEVSSHGETLDGQNNLIISGLHSSSIEAIESEIQDISVIENFIIRCKFG